MENKLKAELHEEFNDIVKKFRLDVKEFLETHNLEQDIVHVQLDKNRPTVKIYNIEPPHTIMADFAVLQDAIIYLVLSA